MEAAVQLQSKICHDHGIETITSEGKIYAVDKVLVNGLMVEELIELGKISMLDLKLWLGYEC